MSGIFFTPRSFLSLGGEVIFPPGERGRLSGEVISSVRSRGHFAPANNSIEIISETLRTQRKACMIIFNTE